MLLDMTRRYFFYYCAAGYQGVNQDTELQDLGSGQNGVANHQNGGKLFLFGACATVLSALMVYVHGIIHSPACGAACAQFVQTIEKVCTFNPRYLQTSKLMTVLALLYMIGLF